MFTLCDANYAMKEWSDVKVTKHNLKIFPWTFIWHKLGLNTFSRYRDRVTETLSKINANCYSKTINIVGYLNKYEMDSFLHISHWMFKSIWWGTTKYVDSHGTFCRPKTVATNAAHFVARRLYAHAGDKMCRQCRHILSPATNIVQERQNVP